MGIKVEYCPELCLRDVSEIKKSNRKKEECLPEKIEKGKIYEFLKEGQRNYWIESEIALRETKGEGNTLRPIASVIITESTHFMLNGKPYTKGKYRVIEVFNPNDPKIHFETMDRIKH